MPDQPTEKKTKSPEEYIQVACSECQRETRHKVLEKATDRLEDGDVYLWRQFQIIQCQGCMTISFCEASQFSEDWEIDSETGEQYIPTDRKLFPSRRSGRALMSESDLLPVDVHSGL